MGGRTWFVFALWIAVVPAWGQSEDEVTAAVGKERDAYTTCLKQHAFEMAKSSEAEDAVVEKVIASCDAERKALLEGLERSPLNVTSEDAAGAVKQATDDLKPRMLQTIKEVRS
jgi:hypothetical protein